MSQPVPKRSKLPTVRVRCLGSGPEHTFLSRDKVRNRVCERCAEKLKAVAKMAGEPIFPVKD